MVLGDLLEGGASEETEGLQGKLPPPMKLQVNRWEVLSDRAVSGWCSLHVFIEVFQFKFTGNIKYAAGRIAKKLTAANCKLRDTDPAPGVGRPPKQARVCDLRRVYTEKLPN